jgi:opacity protein-like surface antigen
VSWSGFYLGGFGSGLLGTADWKYDGGSASPHVGGYSFGGDIGYNYQIGRWVLGVEAELGKTNLLGSTACGPLLADVTGLANAAPFFQMTCNAWANWIGTATGRVGYAWERVLLYVKGGGAWTREYVSATCNLGPNNPIDFVQTPGQACTNPKEAISNGLAGSTNTRGGWVVGYGTEFALTRNWSARAEYNYISFGDRTVIASDGSALNIGMHVSETKVGLNYRFDSGAVYK